MSRLNRNLLAFAFGFALMLLWASSYADSCADLNWTAPTKNTDGTTLTDLTGFRIYFGTTPTALNQSVQVPAGALSQHLCGLTTAKTYFAMTAVNATNIESARTNTANGLPTAVLILSTIDTNVYKQTQGINGYTMVLVGAIPLGFSCSNAHLVDGYSLLPSRDDPAISYKTAIKNCISCKPQSVYAKCALQ